MIENPKLNPSFYTKGKPHLITPIFAQYAFEYVVQLGNLLVVGIYILYPFNIFF